MARFLILIIASCSYSVQAWSMTTTTSSSGIRSVAPTRILKRTRTLYPTFPSTALQMNPSPDDDPSIDGFQLTTKTKKTIVFDERRGRFFETMISEPPKSSRFLSYQPQQQLNDDSFSSTNVMVPTEILFGNRGKSTFPHDEVAVDILASDVALREHADEHHQSTMTNTTARKAEGLRTQQPATQQQTISIVEQCYNAWNQRDMVAAVNCFADGFAYQDSQYIGAFTDTNELARHFAQQASLLPSGCQLVLDAIAADPLNGNILTRWHVEEQNGSIVPLTSGCSFYTTSSETGLITGGFRVLEMLVKPRQRDVNRFVTLASRAFANIAQQERSLPLTSKMSSSSSLSIIEQYFEAWNSRDTEAALDCFIDDCIYQTEDPVFVDAFKGKAALRDHLLQNAAVLPASCRILLDNLAIDPTNGNIGTRWHLVISGIAVPNMQGCSMYTTDPSTGLLTSGFDVTEAPMKLPKQAMILLSLLPGSGSLLGLWNPPK